MWALSKMLHWGPWPYGYKSCLSTTCCLFDHMEFWDIPRSPKTLYVCVRNRKSISDFLLIVTVFRCYSLLKRGSVYSWVTNCTSEKKYGKYCLMPKKKRENPLKWATGYLQFFLEDALSIVTAYARIVSRCKVNSIFQSESELSIHSLLSHYWHILNVSALHTRPVLQNTLSHPRAHVSLLRKLNEWFISGGA